MLCPGLPPPFPTSPHLTLTLCLESSRVGGLLLPASLLGVSRFHFPSQAEQPLLWPVLSAADFLLLLLFFALFNYQNTVTFLKSSRWKLQATPTLPIPAPLYRTLLGSSLFSKKAFGAGMFRPSSAPQEFVFYEDLSQRALKVLGDPWLGWRYGLTFLLSLGIIFSRLMLFSGPLCILCSLYPFVSP